MLIAATWQYGDIIQLLNSQDLSHGRHIKKETSLLIVKEEKRLALSWPLGPVTHAGQRPAQERGNTSFEDPERLVFAGEQKAIPSFIERLLPLPLKPSKLSRISQLWGQSLRGHLTRGDSSVWPKIRQGRQDTRGRMALEYRHSTLYVCLAVCRGEAWEQVEVEAEVEVRLGELPRW